MKTYSLHKWSIVGGGSPYTAPECQTIHLMGYRDNEEHSVMTSRVMEVNGRTITTRNNIYILEDIDPDYLKFLKKNNIPYDQDNPIKLVDQRTPVIHEKSYDPSVN